jgi:competence protein ComEA
MNDRETRTLLRAGLTLLVAAGVRWGVERARPAPALAGGPSALAALDSAAAAAAADDERAARPLAEGERIDPNRADVPDLRRLPGVGESVARAVIASREREGPFRRPEDLERVRGIGPATVARLSAHLDFTRPPTGGALITRPRGGPSLLDPPPSGGAGGAAGGGGQAGGEAGEALDPNNADVAALQQLPGIGPALAQRIVESREREGPFRTADDLLRVRGIGPVVLERIRPRIRLGGR